MRHPKWFIMACPLALSACGVKSMAVRTAADIMEQGTGAFYEESDPVLAKDAMPANLKLAESLLVSAPRDPELLRILAEGFTGYGFLFVEDSSPERAKALYLRAAGYGLRLLALDRRLSALESMPADRLDETLKLAGPEAVPALYWTAYAWALAANLDPNDAELLTRVSRAERMMRRVLELDPGFQYGGPDLFFGVYYSARPRMAGGDLDKARAHFEAALARSGGRYLMARTLYAKYYAVAALDKGLFRALNEAVLSAKPDLPPARLANEVAKSKSGRLLEKIDDLF